MLAREYCLLCRDVFEDRDASANVLKEAPFSDLKPSVVIKAPHDAVSVDAKQALVPVVTLTRAGPEIAQERYAFMINLMQSHLTNFAYCE